MNTNKVTRPLTTMGTGSSKENASANHANTQNQYIDFAPGTPHAKGKNDDKDSQTTHVPTMFRWPYSGRRVFIVGTFNHWKEKIPMTYNSDENSFVVILNVSVGKHLYRFIVDNEYKTDPNSPTCKDEQGYVHNVIEIAESSNKKKVSNHLIEEEEEEEGEEDYDPYDDGYGQEEDVLSDMSDSGRFLPAKQSSPSVRPSIVPPLGTSPNVIVSQHVSAANSSVMNNNAFAGNIMESKAQQQQQQQQQQPSMHDSAAVQQQTNNSHAQTSQHHHHHHHHHHSHPHKRTVSEDVSEPTQMYTQIEHFFEEDKKNPPLLPPHLRYTVLNTTRKSIYDPALLPVPLHVTVNHAYFSDREAMNVIGVTQRYRDKFSTAVLYKPKKIKSH